MEITLLNETELKVTLTAEDMERYSIDCAHMDYGTTETRRAFWSILDEARRETGFDAARDKICIRVYPSTDGGCDMYVTRLTDGEETKENEKKDPADAAEKNGTPLLPGRETCPTALPPRGAGCVYVPDAADTEELIRLCALLCERGCDLPGDAYVLGGKNGSRSGKKRFFLTLSLPTPHGGSGLLPTAILDEFGTRLSSPSMALCLSEHADRIASGHAIRYLAELA